MTVLLGPRVRMFDAQALWTEIREDAISAIDDVGAQGELILGPQVTEFEGSVASLFGCRYAVGVGNATDGLEIALRAAGLKDGDRVLTTPLSAFATTIGIIRAGGCPVFVDTDESGQIDLDLASATLAHDQTIGFLLPVHLYGRPLNLKYLLEIRELNDIRIIEDCAQAIGARWDGQSVGSVGQISVASLYPTKNLGAFGDGGVVVTSDHELASRSRMHRNYGQAAKYIHQFVGLNSRLDELQAAILNRALLPRLDGFLTRRRSIADRYTAGIQNSLVRVIGPESLSEPVWHIFGVRITTDRDQFRDWLAGHGIETSVHYPKLIVEQVAMTKVDHIVATPLDRSARIANQEVSLPIHPFLTDDQVDRVIAVCNRWRP